MSYKAGSHEALVLYKAAALPTWLAGMASRAAPMAERVSAAISPRVQQAGHWLANNPEAATRIGGTVAGGVAGGVAGHAATGGPGGTIAGAGLGALGGHVGGQALGGNFDATQRLRQAGVHASQFGLR